MALRSIKLDSTVSTQTYIQQYAKHLARVRVQFVSIYQINKPFATGIHIVPEKGKVLNRLKPLELAFTTV
jgi:hypothetical protein